jgi:hypothetical protein
LGRCVLIRRGSFVPRLRFFENDLGLGEHELRVTDSLVIQQHPCCCKKGWAGGLTWIAPPGLNLFPGAELVLAFRCATKRGSHPILGVVFEKHSFVLAAQAHKAAIALHIAHYNLCRVHETVRTTRAMALGVAGHVWSITELVAEAQSAPVAPPPVAPEPYKGMSAGHAKAEIGVHRRPVLRLATGGKK